MDTKTVFMFNISSGSIRSVDVDLSDSADVKKFLTFITVNDFPLKVDPSTIKCNKCYGRMYVGRNIEKDEYVLCSKCARKYVDRGIVKLLMNHGESATEVVDNAIPMVDATAIVDSDNPQAV